MKSLLITEQEKKRILGMHKSVSLKHYLMEQNTGTTKTWATVASEAANYLGVGQTQTTNEGAFLNLIRTNIRTQVDLNSLKTEYNKLTNFGVENYDADLTRVLNDSPDLKRNYDNYIKQLK